MRRFGRPLVAIALVASAQVISSPEVQADDTRNRHVIVDSFAEGGISGASEIFALPDEQVQKIINNVETDHLPNRQFCDTLDSLPCAAKTGLSLRIYLPVCGDSTAELCIESLEVSQNEKSPLTRAKYLSTMEGRKYAANPKRGVPEASAPSVWQVPGVMNSGNSDKYVVKVLMDAFISSVNNKLSIFDLNAIVDGDSMLSETQKVALTLRIPNTLTGWLNGRLTDPRITVEKFNENQNRIRVEANPVLVPEVDITLTPEQIAALPNPNFFNIQGITWGSVNAGNPAAIEWIRQLTGAMKNAASGEHTAWFFSTAGGQVTNQCLADKSRVIGLVTTNSPAYAPGAPEFSDGSLNYRVGGLHFKPDGKTLNKGTYDLLIRSDVARCLYNLTNAPLSATVSVSYEGGDQQVETTILNEKDGWLHLGAYGFTYSTPTLRIKLNGVSASSSPQSTTSAQPAPTAQAMPGVGVKVQSIQKNKQILCTKGKVTKKVIGLNPVCPRGWVKK